MNPLFQTLLLCKLLNFVALAAKERIELKTKLLCEPHFLAASYYINLVVHSVVEDADAGVERF